MSQKKPDNGRFNGLIIAMPSYKDITSRTAMCLWNTALYCAKVGLKCDLVMQSGNSVIADCRNNLLAGFMLTGWSHLLWIDDDVEWDAGAIPAMLARMEKAQVDMVCGAYRKKWLDLSRVEYALNFEPTELDSPEQDSETGLVKIYGAPGGFTMVYRGAVQRMMDRNPDLKLNRDEAVPQEAWPFLYDMFSQIREGGKKISEDYSFSRRYKEAGGTIWLDPSIRIHHWGQYCWRGDVISDCFQFADDQTSSAA